MIVADGSIITLPLIVHKTVTLTSTGTISILPNAYSGRYYIIESITIIGRSVSLSQNPTFSIGCNSSSYNDIAASQTLTLATGTNSVTLTTNASKALIAVNTMYLNITNAAIGSGTFEIIIKGYLSNL